MKYLNLAAFALLFTLAGCSQNAQQTDSKSDTTLVVKTDSAAIVKKPDTSADKAEIQGLIRKTLNWAEHKNEIDLLPALTDSKDSSCIGFDKIKLKANLEKLKATGYFSQTFIENYNQIILTLDKKIRGKEFEKWNTYELPTFAFGNDADPWCECQDVPFDKPDPWSLVDIEVISLEGDKGELNWKWGGFTAGANKSWADIKYRFKVEKENGQWKIAYLQGFDFANAVKKDGV